MKLQFFKRFLFRRAIGMFPLLLFSVWTAGRTFAEDGSIRFNRDVRPILAKHCWSCHGPDQDAREADLRLDQFEAATELHDGRQAIQPGKPQQSEMIRRIVSQDVNDRMPPADSGPPLGDSQISILRDWIAQGASYEPHWAFVPPRKPPLPVLRTHQQPGNAIDSFILAKLEEVGLNPSDQAERSALYRRLWLDLLGIPPNAEDAKAFASNADPNAYEAEVDRLLSRPEFGEKWGRAWLDLARYSDTNGYEKDRPRSIWPYRDWVIQALQNDLPFDSFTIQQIAGDMLDSNDPSNWIATGFHRNTMLNEEGGIDPLEFRFYAMNDRVATTGLIWLGLTTGCAQCHSHKFDPISQKEYYELMALLNNADEPDFEVPTSSVQSQQAKIQNQIAEMERILPERYPIDAALKPYLHSKEESTASRLAFDEAFERWVQRAQSEYVSWHSLVPRSMKTNLPRLEILEDRSIFSTGDITKRDVFHLTIDANAFGDEPITALRLEVLPDSRLPAGGPGRCYYEGRRGDFFLSEVVIKVGERPVKIRDSSHSYGKNGLGSGSADAKNVYDGDGSTGWSTAQREGQSHQLVLLLDQPQRIDSDVTVEMIFERHYAASLGRFRWSATSSHGEVKAIDIPEPLPSILAKGRNEWSSEEVGMLKKYFADKSPELDLARKGVERLRASLPKPATTLVMQERPSDNPRPTFRHHRGEYLSPREEVRGNIPEIFHGWTKHPPRNRLELARWLASSENPLVARVVVNRVWQSFFGEGLVRSQGDFGMQSSPPTHPQLLDWLAVEWIESGWSLKKLCRDIVLSATYRRSSHWSSEQRDRDPENLWLSRFSRQRVEAEAVRDAMLTASGLLCRIQGGPSVRPPQPVSVTGLAYGRDSWATSEGQDRYRRSLYTFSKRTAPFAAYSVFDAPSGESCAVRRERSNTPLQALTLLNDSMFLEMAEALGSRVCREEQEEDRRAMALAWHVWSREASRNDIDSIKSFVESMHLQATRSEVVPELHSPDSKSIRLFIKKEPRVWGWILAARALMNTDEAIVKP